DNIANFNSGEITGTLVGGNIGGTGNTLNVNDTKLKAGNVASFNIMNFTGNIASTTDVASSALILSSANDDTNLDGVEIWLNGNKYSSNSDYGLSANQKYYLIAHENKANVNYKKLTNYAYGADEKTIGDGSIAIDVTQSDQYYRIIDSQTYTRNLRGMFADTTAQKNIYIIANSEIKENIGSLIGDDVFEKFGKSKTGNTVTIDPDDKNSDLDLSNTAIGGSDSTGNTLNVGKDNTNPIKMNKIKISNVTNFDTINMYLPDPTPNETVIEITNGSNTDVSKSNINVFINDVSKFTSGRIHLLKADNGQVISNPGTVKVKAQIGAIATAETNSLDLVYKGGSGGTSTNDQTKIFSEARLGALGALWQGQYLIANHLDRVIPDAFSELFPYAITESYDKRFNTGSHVDTRGFNANAGFASKDTNSSGEFTMGPFLDYGFSNYDAYLDDGTHGDGKNYYIGGGFFGKQENNSGSYFEATFRIGQLVTEFNGDLTLNGVSKNYDFDLKSTYYAFHAGLGKVYNLNANNNLDIYGRFFYTHIESADNTINGTKTEFDAVQSKKIRLGFKDDYKFNENHAIYAGAAYEYEFDAKAGGRVLVLGSNAEMKQPSLRGSTGIGEIGYQYKKDETLKFDVGVKGYVGKQEGVSAQMAISIAF
ncbi:MAG: autotransporter domain-containing protein, partial [Campylobacter sp.]|nr:autotransporter domain-containing protein [Campylobacter sp.]